MKKIICAILSVVIFFACSEGNKKENFKKEIYSTWKGTDVPKVIHYLDTTGTKDVVAGESVCYPNGQVNFEGFYKDGKQDGKWLSFYSDGKQKAIYNYKEGEFHGKYINYFENGQVKIEGKYEKGKKVGVWKTYDNNGKLRKEEDFSKK